MSKVQGQASITLPQKAFTKMRVTLNACKGSFLGTCLLHMILGPH